jgi:hypothetical protein
VVFSKDRAMQLDACLKSIANFAPYAGPVTVIYKATTQNFAAAYHAIETPENVELVEESRFEHVVRDIVGDHAYTVFHTDDDVFFRAPPPLPAPDEHFATVSLRLGENTTYCYAQDAAQPLPPFTADGPLRTWDWTSAAHDFAYPMSLNGHVFNTSLLKRLLTRARFTNPNQLEEELHLRRHRAPRWMVACAHSCVVSIPANIVTSTHTNRASAEASFSPTALNERFLRGERIDFSSMDFSSIHGAHQEIPLRFEARSTPV